LETTSQWLLDYPQAASYLGITERHLRHLWQTRQIGARKIGKMVRFAPEDLRAFADAQKVEAVS
jgi:excisionase family DNA binding protein